MQDTKGSSISGKTGKAADAFSAIAIPCHSRMQELIRGNAEICSLMFRVAVERQSSDQAHEGMKGSSPKGGSPKGMSPGGSPTKPPRIPKNAFRHFFKAMIPKRSSHVDLW